MNRLKKFIRDSSQFALFLVQIILKTNWKNSIKREKLGKVIVLANGPSLKQDLPTIIQNQELEKTDFIVLNFFAFDKSFFKIKPKHYCLADPMFFKENHKINDVRQLFDILQNKVDWELNIYIPKSFAKDFLPFSKLKNPKLNIIVINNIDYIGYERFRNFFYKKGLSVPRIQTVANLAIYVGIARGFSEIHLYGVDHSFLANLVVNQKNELCNLDTHFYSEKEQLTPIIHPETGKVWKIGDYLEAIMYMFKSHELLNNFSNYLGTRILNYTKDSMIDSYERLC